MPAFRKSRTQPLKSHVPSKQAIIIGGGIAGLLAARVLLNHFEQVTLLERDQYPDEPVFRPGVPQGRQIHTLLLRGQQILERMFPGIQTKLLGNGAINQDYASDAMLYYSGGRAPHLPSALPGWQSSRLLLEWQIRQELANYPQLHIVQGYEVVHLLFEQKTSTVFGVQIRARNQEPQAQTLQEVKGDLIIDASGSSSRAPEWLKEIGYDVPEETVVNGGFSYATRWYERPPHFQKDWKLIVIHRAPPSQRAGVVMEIEGDRWTVALIGAQNNHPPTNDEDFLNFAKSLPYPILYESIKEAIPNGKIYGYRRTANRIRHFERLKRFPERFLVIGDAVCCFNPIYAQGMTVAALEAETLDAYLPVWKERQGFSRHFQRTIARTVFAAPWQLATTADISAMNKDERPKERTIQRISRWYVNRLTTLLPHDQHVLLTFLQVHQMLKPSSALMHPIIVAKVMAHRTKNHTHEGVNNS